MRRWQIAPVLAAMVTAHVAPVAAEALVPAGLGGGMDTGGVLGVTAQPGTRLSSRFRLRVGEMAPVAVPGMQTIAAAPRPRRIATMVDFYPAPESGFRVSAGMRILSKRGRQSFALYKATQPGSAIYAPAMAAKLPLRNNITQTAPAATLGWTRRLSDKAVFGIEAGTIMEHGRGRKTAVAIANPDQRPAEWSRIDPVAQVAFAMKF